MSASTESPYSVTARTGAGYDASLVTVRGDTAAELHDNLTELLQGSLAELIVDLQSTLQAVANLKAPVPEAPSTPAAPVQASEPAGAPVANLRVCPHGQRVKKTGNSAKGAWTGWFCPLPKGNPNQCKPDWE